MSEPLRLSSLLKRVTRTVPSEPSEVGLPRKVSPLTSMFPPA